MSNRLIELHDSEIEKIFCLNDDVVIVFSIVYIHQSEGRPGIDSGNVWTQKAEILFLGGSLRGQFESFPVKLSDGGLKIDNKFFDNVIPILHDEAGKIELNMVSQSCGREVIICGTKVTLKLLGEPKYVEEFPGAGL